MDITLDEEHTDRLTKLASRIRAQPDVVARFLLTAALDDADSDPLETVKTLDGIPGAYERAIVGLAQAKSGKTVQLRDL